MNVVYHMIAICMTILPAYCTSRYRQIFNFPIINSILPLKWKWWTFFQPLTDSFSTVLFQHPVSAPSFLLSVWFCLLLYCFVAILKLCLAYFSPLLFLSLNLHVSWQHTGCWITNQSQPALKFPLHWHFFLFSWNGYILAIHITN